ncbi:hypothetical protein NUM3379_25320 [Kineococcus sp. NUM-3379]
MSGSGRAGTDHFLRMFEVEARAALDRLGRDLLVLEAGGADGDLVAGMFRDAHNLKGGAAVVGLVPVQRVAHAMEELLEPVRAGTASAGPVVVDALLHAVDALAAALPGLVAGSGDGSGLTAVEAELAAVSREPGAEQPGAERPGAERPGAERPGAERPGAERPGAEQPGAEQPGAGGPGARGTAPATRTAPATQALPAAQTLPVPVARLDDLIRLVGEAAAAQLRLGAYLSGSTDVDPVQVSEFRDLSAIVNELQEKTSGTRMVPVSTVTDTLARAVRDLARSQGKQIRFEVRGGDTELDLAVLARLVDPLVHVVRNAVDHGVESPDRRTAAGKAATGEVRLHAMRLGAEVVLSVRDDGGGIDVAALRERAGAGSRSGAGDSDLALIFRTGLSTAPAVSEVSGRGVGMDAVRANVAAVRGRVDVRSEPGVFTEIRISVPVTLAVLRCLLVSAGGVRYALPMTSLVTALPPQAEPEVVDARAVRWVTGRPVPVRPLAEVLAVGTRASRPAGPVVVVSGVTRRFAFEVDELLTQREVVVKGLSPLLPRLDAFMGVSAEADGSVLLVLEPTGLIDRARGDGGRHGDATAALPALAPAPPATAVAPPRAPRVLVVDDALTIRELQRSVLEGAGYHVLTAEDGRAALDVLRTEAVDLVLTDVEMPRMDGFALTAAVRGGRGPEGGEPPRVVILTTRDGEADRSRGLAAGADDYIVKNGFTESALLSTVERLVGPA